MCAIFGFFGKRNSLLSPQIAHLAQQATERGRDGIGLMWVANGLTGHARMVREPDDTDWPGTAATFAFGQLDNHMPSVVLGNVRAAPTTEGMTSDCNQLQPYLQDGVWCVHNGTIANDRDWIDRGIDSKAIPVAASRGEFHKLVGSQATAMYVERTLEILPGFTVEQGSLVLYRDFRPLHAVWVGADLFFASKQEWLPEGRELKLPGYCVTAISPDRQVTHHQLKQVNEDHAVVVLSGGLDSTVCATVACGQHAKVDLVHFHYGCRAQQAETTAVKQIAASLAQQFPQCEVRLHFLDLGFLKQLGGSTLLDPQATIAQGEAGAEFAHEWVPFRNGLMLSMVAAFCDRWNIGSIYLGANLEEAGAYGDNEVEFFEHFERALAIGSQARPRVRLPVGNLMKHEIVRLAGEIDVPVHLSYSCYHGRQLHCGQCGPCFMRKTAFAINNQPDPIQYEDQQ